MEVTINPEYLQIPRFYFNAIRPLLTKEMYYETKLDSVVIYSTQTKLYMLLYDMTMIKGMEVIIK